MAKDEARDAGKTAAIAFGAIFSIGGLLLAAYKSRNEKARKCNFISALWIVFILLFAGFMCFTEGINNQTFDPTQGTNSVCSIIAYIFGLLTVISYITSARMTEPPECDRL